MSAPKLARAQQARANHIHLPSIHVRNEDGSGFDYEENYFVRGRGRKRSVQRVVTIAAFNAGGPLFECETRDVLCREDLEALESALPVLMEEGNVAAEEVMKHRAQLELNRQKRILTGYEQSCASCGCSESRACSGGCIWATKTICSRCV